MSCGLSVACSGVQRRAASVLRATSKVLKQAHESRRHHTGPLFECPRGSALFLACPNLAADVQAISMTPTLRRPRLYSFFGTSFTATHMRSNLLTTKITIYEEQIPTTRAAYYAMLDSLSRPGLDVLYTTPGYVDTVLDEMITHDVVLSAYAFGFVGICLLIHTASPFLTLMAIFNILFSFPLALFIYRNICGQTQPLPLLALGSAFVVIGIAVDDIFVFVDMFKQSTSADMTGRVAHTVQTAVKATLFTSVTSATSFASNALSQIPAVHDFGLLSAILVIANYLMVSTFMLSALVVWQNYIRGCEAAMFRCFPECLRPMPDQGDNVVGGLNPGNVPEYEVPADDDDDAGGADGMRMVNPVFQFQNDDLLLVDAPDADGVAVGGGYPAAAVGGAAAAAAAPAAAGAKSMSELSGANKVSAGSVLFFPLSHPLKASACTRHNCD